MGSVSAMPCLAAMKVVLAFLYLAPASSPQGGDSSQNETCTVDSDLAAHFQFPSKLTTSLATGPLPDAQVEASSSSVKGRYNPFVPTWCSSHAGDPVECNSQKYKSGSQRCEFHGIRPGSLPSCDIKAPVRVPLPKDPLNLGSSLTTSGREDFIYIQINEYLMSPNGYFKAIMQNDCNFVVYSRPQFSGEDNKFVYHGTWRPGHDGNCYAAFQGSDGNLVIYFTDGTEPAPVGSWCGSCIPENGFQLEMQDDGNLVTYTKVQETREHYWASNTVGAASDVTVFELGLTLPPPFSPRPAFTTDTLGPGDVLRVNQSIVSQDGYFTLKMEENCNLVMYVGFIAPLWASNTVNKGNDCSLHVDFGKVAIINGEGILVKKINPIWSQNPERCDVCSRLILQNDANLVFYEDKDQSPGMQWSARPSHATGLCSCTCQPNGWFSRGSVVKYCYARGEALCRRCYEDCGNACNLYDTMKVLNWIMGGVDVLVAGIAGVMALLPAGAAEAGEVTAEEVIVKAFEDTGVPEEEAEAAASNVMSDEDSLMTSSYEGLQFNKVTTGQIEMKLTKSVERVVGDHLDTIVEVTRSSAEDSFELVPTEQNKVNEQGIALKSKEGLKWAMTASNDEINFLIRKVGTPALCEIRIGDVTILKGSKMTSDQFAALTQDNSEAAFLAFKELQGAPAALWERELFLVRDWLERVRPNGQWQF